MLSSLFGKNWDPRGRHCYVQGGSSGLGLALSVILAQRGASVYIVARDEAKLAAALEKLEGARVDERQVFQTFSFSVATLAGATEAYDAVCAANGGATPDVAFLCAGGAYPGFWVEADEATIRKSMDMTYWVAAWSAKAIADRMVREKRTGKIVFTASILGYFGIAGYAAYAPGKFAIRGLAETLRQEMLLYDIGVHLYLPATFQSPSYELENSTKPQLTLKIEESDPIMTAEECAQGMLAGVMRGDFHITDSFNGHAFRTSTRGSTPWNGLAGDLFYGLIGFIGIPLWRRGVDKMVVQHKKEHQEYLRSKGFFNAAQ